MNEWWRRRTLYGLLTFDGDDVMTKGCVLFDEMRHLFPQYEHFTVELINEKRSNYDYTERGKEV